MAGALGRTVQPDCSVYEACSFLGNSQFWLFQNRPLGVLHRLGHGLAQRASAGCSMQNTLGSCRPCSPVEGFPLMLNQDLITTFCLPLRGGRAGSRWSCPYLFPSQSLSLPLGALGGKRLTSTGHFSGATEASIGDSWCKHGGATAWG